MIINGPLRSNSTDGDIRPYVQRVTPQHTPTASSRTIQDPNAQPNSISHERPFQLPVASYYNDISASGTEMPRHSHSVNHNRSYGATPREDNQRRATAPRNDFSVAFPTSTLGVGWTQEFTWPYEDDGSLKI